MSARTSLWWVELISDVFVDACLRDPAGNLLFLSCFCRDTSMQQLLAAIALPAAQGGLDYLTLRSGSSKVVAQIGDEKRLTKLTGRLPKDNLFGNLVHAWLFDERIQKPDFANRAAWLIDQASVLADPDVRDRRVWELYTQLSPIPLLPHWHQAVLAVTRAQMVMDLADSDYPPVGDIAAIRVALGDDFIGIVSTLVRTGVLTLEPPAPVAGASADVAGASSQLSLLERLAA